MASTRRWLDRGNPRDAGVRHACQGIFTDIEKALAAMQALFLFSTLGTEQPLHHIILWIGSAVAFRAVFLHNLVNLIPKLIDLLHVLQTDIHIRRYDSRPWGYHSHFRRW